MKKYMGYIIFNILLIVALLVLGLYGYLNKSNNYSSKKEINNKQVTNNKLTTDDKAYLKNVAISIFNDSFKFLTFKSDEGIIISEEGKITSTAKTMYLNGSLNTTKKMDDTIKKSIVTNTKTLFNSDVTFKDFTINYSNDYCGIGGYNSNSGELKDTDNNSSGKCSLPFMVFEVGSASYKDNVYSIKVYNAFVEQEQITASKECKTNEEGFSKLLKGYSDYFKKENIYNSKVVGCCTKGTCETAAIYGEKDKIMNIAKENNSYYLLSFTKTNNNFSLESITKAES